jgi:serine protease DegQ
MRKFWLLFAQSTTIALGILFIIALFRPDILRWEKVPALTIHQAPTPRSEISPTESFAPAAQKVIPSVVNIFTQQKMPSKNHPALNDPIFRYFFGDRLDERPRQASNLGSGVIVSPNGFILTNHHVIEGADEIQIALRTARPYRHASSAPIPKPIWRC